MGIWQLVLGENRRGDGVGSGEARGSRLQGEEKKGRCILLAPLLLHGKVIIQITRHPALIPITAPF